MPKRKTLGPINAVIDRPKGYEKVWPRPDGSEKRFVYPVDYGYFSGITGEDGEGLDIFLGDEPGDTGHFESFQKLKPDGTLDETKFLAAVNDSDRQTIYDLYGTEVYGRQVYPDVHALWRAALEFAPKAKDRYMTRPTSSRYSKAVLAALARYGLKAADIDKELDGVVLSSKQEGKAPNGSDVGTTGDDAPSGRSDSSTEASTDQDGE